MLKNTFRHIPGIGPTSEARIWSLGVTDWDCLHRPKKIELPPKRLETLTTHALESTRQFERGNPLYFANLLPSNQHWRLFPEFRERAAYIDIETDGLDVYGGTITTIALYDGQSIYHYVNGQNLDDFITDIRRYKVLVSYNGKTFDVPFIQNYFDIELPQVHIDLRYVLGSLGYKGGLKNCERALGIDRGTLKGLDGFFAPLLWQEYRYNHNPKALETLLAYNIEDVINLEALMVCAYNRNVAHTPFAQSHAIPPPQAPPIPFEADLQTIESVKSSVFTSNPYGY